MTKFLYVKSDERGFLRVDVSEFKFAVIYKAFAKDAPYVWLNDDDAVDFLTEIRQRGIEFEVIQQSL